MEQIKSNILTHNLARIAEQFELNPKFWQELRNSNIFPSEYIEHMKGSIESDDIKKKNIIIDLKRRESHSYEKFSNILRTLNKCDILDQYMQCLSKDAYPIVSDKPGTCLIINNKKFLTHNPREGSDKDVTMFRALFERMNYEMVVKEDLSRKQLLDLLKECSKKEELRTDDIFVTIIMSHGISEHVVTSDDEFVHYDEILDFFGSEHCQHLVNKPKVFIFNCCRSLNASLPEKSLKKENPTFSDILMIFSTLNSYLSVRDEESGTLFAKAFTSAMENNPNDDVCTIVTKANNLLTEMVMNEPKNNVELRQAIEQRKLGPKKNFHFSKLRHS